MIKIIIEVKEKKAEDIGTGIPSVDFNIQTSSDNISLCENKAYQSILNKVAALKKGRRTRKKRSAK